MRSRSRHTSIIGTMSNQPDETDYSRRMKLGQIHSSAHPWFATVRQVINTSTEPSACMHYALVSADPSTTTVARLASTRLARWTKIFTPTTTRSRLAAVLFLQVLTVFLTHMQNSVWSLVITVTSWTKSFSLCAVALIKLHVGQCSYHTIVSAELAFSFMVTCNLRYQSSQFCRLRVYNSRPAHLPTNDFTYVPQMLWMLASRNTHRNDMSLLKPPPLNRPASPFPSSTFHNTYSTRLWRDLSFCGPLVGTSHVCARRLLFSRLLFGLRLPIQVEPRRAPGAG